MSDESIEAAELPLTEQDEADLATLHAEPATQRTLLEVWTHYMSNVDGSEEQKITAPVAMKVVSSWPFLVFADLPRYWEAYHGYLREARDTLAEVIAANPDCFENTAADATDNHKVYCDLLVEWHKNVIRQQFEWDLTADPHGVEIAASADARNFVLGPKGMVGHLEAIQFQYTLEERDAFTEALAAYETELG